MFSFTNCTRRQWLLVLSILFMMECYFNVCVYYKVLHGTDNNRHENIYHNTSTSNLSRSHCTPSFTNVSEGAIIVTSSDNEPIVEDYKYPLINSTEIAMDYNNKYNSSYHWFISMKPLFKKLYEETIYQKSLPTCRANESALGPVKVNKTELKLEWVEQQHPTVKLGGYHAPAHCHAKYRVAIIIPNRDRRKNLIILLNYIHPMLQKQLLDYRIFVIEQYGKEKFNKGTLFNIAFLEIQRFGNWHCLIFQDVDLVPEDERISYSCPEQPTHLATAVDKWCYVLPYAHIFGGVTALTMEQYRTVNGYSNFYWDWGGEDDDMYGRILSKNYTILRYNLTIARYTTLPHPSNDLGKEKRLLLFISRLRYLKEGLLTTQYKLIKVTNQKLYTHILADVNPTKMKLDTKSIMQRLIRFHGKTIEYGRQELHLQGMPASVLKQYLKIRKEAAATTNRTHT